MRRGFRNSRNENSVGAFATTSSETSSTGSRSSWSAVQQLSEDDKMAVIRGNARSSDIFCGLEETAVDSDEDDLSSVNTEVHLRTLLVWLFWFLINPSTPLMLVILLVPWFGSTIRQFSRIHLCFCEPDWVYCLMKFEQFFWLVSCMTDRKLFRNLIN